MPPEYAAIGGLFSALVAANAAIITMQQKRIDKLERKNEKLEERLDASNEASRNLIFMQAELLRSKGVQIVSSLNEGGR